MKSFADWTDEIRALMNPPVPVLDTCNWLDTSKAAPADLAAFRRGRYEWRDLVIDGRDDLWFYNGDQCNEQEQLVPTLRNAHLWECRPGGKVHWHSEEELAKRGIAPLDTDRQAEKREALALALMYGSSGRRTGKSRLQAEYYKRLFGIIDSDYSKLEERIMAGGAAWWSVDWAAVGKGSGPSIVIYDEVSTFDPKAFGTIKIEGKA